MTLDDKPAGSRTPLIDPEAGLEWPAALPPRYNADATLSPSLAVKACPLANEPRMVNILGKLGAARLYSRLNRDPAVLHAYLHGEVREPPKFTMSVHGYSTRSRTDGGLGQERVSNFSFAADLGPVFEFEREFCETIVPEPSDFAYRGGAEKTQENTKKTGCPSKCPLEHWARAYCADPETFKTFTLRKHITRLDLATLRSEAERQIRSALNYKDCLTIDVCTGDVRNIGQEDQVLCSDACQQWKWLLWPTWPLARWCVNRYEVLDVFWHFSLPPAASAGQRCDGANRYPKVSEEALVANLLPLFKSAAEAGVQGGMITVREVNRALSSAPPVDAAAAPAAAEGPCDPDCL
ncbi:hypothetical protein HDU87_007222 [Geranomyces variabilis]|uniref:Uncharacterized protein n=1 Tax=Geranomyces variabilis TaxID=109894 RepID=A0AAD5TE63_9FUNG|nr:hypothetical protein HDU87_007222 [Geranomyces variabilis]